MKGKHKTFGNDYNDDLAWVLTNKAPSWREGNFVGSFFSL